MSKMKDHIIEHHNKELELFENTIQNMWYDSILDFLNGIDPNWIGTTDLEIMKKILTPLYKHFILWE